MNRLFVMIAILGVTFARASSAKQPENEALSADGRFVISGTTVTDKKTGLIWQRHLDPEDNPFMRQAFKTNVKQYTPAQAFKRCETLNLGGISSGWRLPTLEELKTLVKPGGRPTIDSQAFPKTEPGLYWTSSDSKPGVRIALSFADGTIKEEGLGEGMGDFGSADKMSHGNRCVHTPEGDVHAASSDSRYAIDHGTVIDHKTSLVWQQVADSHYLTRANAANRCAALKLGKFKSGWRLPAMEELVTLLHVGSVPLLDETLFPNARSGSYWTAPSGDRARLDRGCVDFSGLNYNCVGGVGEGPYRCVHSDGEASPSGASTTDIESIIVGGFEWQAVPSPKHLPWAGGSSYCSALKLNGPGWRLPTKSEFLALVQTAQAKPEILTSVDLRGGPFWTSSRMDKEDYAKGFQVSLGTEARWTPEITGAGETLDARPEYNDIRRNLEVRCVRPAKAHGAKKR